MKQKFYICKHWGNIVAMIRDKGVPLHRCGEKMHELIPGTTEASGEKHIPVYEVRDNVVHVTVGAAEHPMTKEHYSVVLDSGEVITEFTALAEKQTECFTGIPINKEITRKTQGLQCRERQCGSTAQMIGKVRRLNRTGLKLLDGLIGFKENTLKCVLQCEMFTLNYPLLIEHIIREANQYLRLLQCQ